MTTRERRERDARLRGEMMNTIDTQLLRERFYHCLFKQEEVLNGTPEDAVLVEGIRISVGLHPERLEETREQVREWLSLLPKRFQDGDSFLNACTQEDGVLWTGEHQTVEQLFLLGMGLGLVQCLAPKEMWPMLPGGMPYYRIRLEE